MASSHDPLPRAGAERVGTGKVRAQGDKELVREEGESPLDDSLPECIPIILDALDNVMSSNLGLSFPVGPFPSGDLVDGGRLKA